MGVSPPRKCPADIGNETACFPQADNGHPTGTDCPSGPTFRPSDPFPDKCPDKADKCPAGAYTL